MPIFVGGLSSTLGALEEVSSLKTYPPIVLKALSTKITVFSCHPLLVYAVHSLPSYAGSEARARNQRKLNQ